MLFISLILNILFMIILTYIIKFNKKKLLAKIIFLKTQLEIFKQQKGNKRYRSSIFQKIKLSILYSYLKFPKKLCYIYKPETVLKWYRNIIKKFWTFPFTRNNIGRPPISIEIIKLILKLKRENHNWGCRRIQGELKKLDKYVSKSKIAEILIKYGLDPTDYGLTWSKFLKSHINSLFAFDIKTTTTLFGTRLYIFFFISLHSRKIIHFNITLHPTKKWIEIQLRNFVYNFDNKIYLIRDNDQLFKYIDFNKFNIDNIPISLKAPNMNAFIERFIGSFKREALNHFIIFNESQLRYIVKEYVIYYNNFRPHQGIGNVTIPEYVNNYNANNLQTYNKIDKRKILKQKFLNGLLNHYYYKTAA